MDDRQTLPSRKLSLAALLSLFGTGAGHLYAGRPRRGLILFALTLLFVPVCIVMSRMPPSLGVFWTITGSMALLLLVYLVAILDAMWCARRAPRPYSRRPCNHSALYVLLAVAATSWAVAGVFLVRATAFEAFIVPTRSMESTIGLMDRVLVNKYRDSEIARDTLVVFRSPHKPKQIWIKRVVGIGTDTIEFRDGSVLRNGIPLADARAPETPDETIVVPTGHVYVLGDNRAARASRDSRSFGVVPAGTISGTVEYLLPRGEFPRVLK